MLEFSLHRIQAAVALTVTVVAATEGECFNKDCGCPPNFKRSWCAENGKITGWNVGWAKNQGNCESGGNVWCEKTVAAPKPKHEKLVKADTWHTTHGCKCLAEWKYNGKHMKNCGSTPAPFANGRRWCQVSESCLTAAGKQNGMRWDFCFDGPDTRTLQVLTMDPCPASVQDHNGAKPWRRNLDSIPEVLLPLTNVTSNAVCCSEDGKSCGTFAWNEKILLCEKDLKYEAAKRVCERRGLRLCSPDELQGGVCCYRLWNVCNIRNVWSNKEKRVPENWGELKDVDFKGGQIAVDDFLTV